MTEEYYLYILIIFFILASAFFSATETGVTTSSLAKLHKLKTAGNKNAKIITSLREEKERFFGALLLGNTIVNIAASAIATSIAIKVAGEEGVIYATLIMTFVILIFGELLPKTLAFQHAETVALLNAPLMSLIVKILGPITCIFAYIVKILSNFFAIFIPKQENVSTSDEIRGAIEFHHSRGLVVKSDRDMLGSIFDLSETDVSEIMIHRKGMVTFNINSKVEDLIKFMSKTSNHTRIPLWKDNPDNIVGILNLKDLFKAVTTTKKTSEIDISKLMTKPWFIPETTPLKTQLYQFRKKRKHFAIVIDEYGSLKGLVTLEDILEEIVGQIEDEHDTVSKSFLKIDKKNYLVKGQETIRDFNRVLNLDLPDDDASTLAGLIIHEAKRIPDKGEIFIIYNLKMEIKECQDNYIDLIKITILDNEE